MAMKKVEPVAPVPDNILQFPQGRVPRKREQGPLENAFKKLLDKCDEILAGMTEEEKNENP